MTDTRLMYGTVSGAEALLREPPPKSAAQAAAPYVAEFMGTFVIVFTVGCCQLSPGNPSWNATAVGCVLMAMIYGTASISGGHLNPAISLALTFIGALRWPVLLGYWAVQLAGALTAGLCYFALFMQQAPRADPSQGYPLEWSCFSEVLYTAVLCFVFCSCSASKRNNPKEDPNQFFPLAVGFAMMAAGYAASSVSGDARLNPALSLALDVSNVAHSGLLIPGWAFAELFGAALGAAAFRATRPEDFGVEEDLSQYRPSLIVRCLAEFLGVFVIMLTAGLMLISKSSSAPWSVGAALTCMTYSVWDVSGAHFNPAVTLAVVLSDRDRCSLSAGLFYVITQLSAASLAGLVFAQLQDAGPMRDVTFPLEPGAGYGHITAGIAELVFSLALCYTVLSCALLKTSAAWRTKQNTFFGIAIGVSIFAAGVAVGAVSGGIVNPALSVGITVAGRAHHAVLHGSPTQYAYAGELLECLLFSAWQLGGGFLAAGVFRLTHAGEFKKTPLLRK